MTWRVSPFAEAAIEIDHYVRATYAPLGIVLAGSIVRGEAGPTSDFDVCVVHDGAWRLREQRRFNGVPAELFLNPPDRVRRYFETEHAEGRPCTAHMFATGEILDGAQPIIHELVREARDWLARPYEPTAEQLTSQRYQAVDTLDDARDVVACDPAACAVLLGEAVQLIVVYAFSSRGKFQPRRKATVDALTSIDPEAASLIHRWATSTGVDAFSTVEALARHVLGVDTFFEWSSAREAL